MSIHSIKGRGVNNTFKDALWAVRVSGVSEDSRNGAVRTIPEPFLITHTNPNERVIFCEARKENPFFHFMECIWMLAGSNEVNWISQFNPRMMEYAEPHGVIHGAYGHRWRNRFQVDQILDVVDLLRTNPFTRRAVINMWSAQHDLGSDAKDLPCLSGDTTLKSPEGNISLQELARRFSDKEISRWPVYSYNEKSQSYSLAWCDRVWKSGHKKTIKLNFMDRTSLRCTPDHILYFRTHGRGDVIQQIQAGKLQPGWQVLGHPFWASRDWEVLQTRVASTNYEPVHELYTDFLGWNREGLVVHHRDNDPRNNKASNLEVMSRNDHARHHTARAPGVKLSKRKVVHTEPRYNNTKAHTITSIEECDFEDVYDFSVPGNHTALVNSGVVAHNCNTQIYFRCIDDRLDMTVLNRSNDLIWGMLGSNVVHFSFLHEVIAHAIGMRLGHMHQFSNNVHVYEHHWHFLETPPHCESYAEAGVYPYLLHFADLAKFLDDCEKFVAGERTRNRFFDEVADPIFAAWTLGQLEILEDCAASDWRRACTTHLERRLAGQLPG